MLPSPSLSIHLLAKVKNHLKRISVLNISAMCVKTGRWEKVRCCCLNCVFSVISSASASCKHQYLKTMQTGRTLQSPHLIFAWISDKLAIIYSTCVFSPSQLPIPSQWGFPSFILRSCFHITPVHCSLLWRRAGRQGWGEGGDPRLPAVAGGRWDHSRCGCKIMEANWPQQSPSIPFGVYPTEN